MPGDIHLKQLAHAYAAHVKHFAHFQFKGQDCIPHNPKNNRRTKSRGRK